MLPLSLREAEAKDILSKNDLLPDQLSGKDTRWRTTWSKIEKGIKKAVLQCRCGVDPRLHNSTKISGAKVTFPFRNCLAHVRISYDVEDRNNEKVQLGVRTVEGLFQHSLDCKKATQIREGRIPLHPDVVAMAMAGLTSGQTASRVLNDNVKFINSQVGQNSPAAKDRIFMNGKRILLDSRDIGNIRRNITEATLDINMRTAPEVNVHNLLTSVLESDSVIRESVCHYVPKTTLTPRFEVVISTAEMCQLAWKYTHNRTLLMDGTFGLTKEKILVFILMGIDESYRGIPIGIFLFSARKGNNRTSAGYDAAVLENMLNKWTTSLNVSPSSLGRHFECAICMTDCDTKERNALLSVFPKIHLLLCLYHVSLCWKNKLTDMMGRGGCAKTKALRGQISEYIRNALLRIKAEPEERNIYAIVNFLEDQLRLTIARGLSNNYPTAALTVIQGGLAFCTYLRDWWVKPDIISHWSIAGRKKASEETRIPLNEIPTTNNHVEGFNSLLKGRELPMVQNNSRRLRIDIFLVYLVKEMVPSILARRSLQRERDQYIKERDMRFPAGRAPKQAAAEDLKMLMAQTTSIAFYTEDKIMDEYAKQLLAAHRENFEIQTWDGRTCEVKVPSRTSSSVYLCVLSPVGKITCPCYRFQQRGGFCTHLRAAHLFLPSVPTLPDSFPKPSLNETRKILEEQNLAVEEVDSIISIAKFVSDEDKAVHDEGGKEMMEINEDNSDEFGNTEGPDDRSPISDDDSEFNASDDTFLNRDTTLTTTSDFGDLRIDPGLFKSNKRAIATTRLDSGIKTMHDALSSFSLALEDSKSAADDLDLNDERIQSIRRALDFKQGQVATQLQEWKLYLEAVLPDTVVSRRLPKKTSDGQVLEQLDWEKKQGRRTSYATH